MEALKKRLQRIHANQEHPDRFAAWVLLSCLGCSAEEFRLELDALRTMSIISFHLYNSIVKETNS